MKEKIENLIAVCQKRIANLKWHLEVNGWTETEEGKRHIQRRITDQEDFIYELKKL